MPQKPDLQKISRLLNRGTVEVQVKTVLEHKLLSGIPLNIKFGIDPTGSDLHLGHMVVIRKLREFQELGHNIQLLFGNFTGQIGDPTGKSETRTLRTQSELEKNAKHYINQVKTFLNVDKIKVCWNAEWLSPLTFADVIKLASNFTVAQMMERDMFQERIKKNAPISLHEFFYPLMQGYDSVALKSNVELGATEQTFNLLAGRVLQKAYGQAPQDIMTVPILVGTDGKIKMGKTTGNYIGVNEQPNQMYGKVMSIPDDVIVNYFELATGVSDQKIAEVKKAMAEGENPRNLKMELARQIVSEYHSIEKSKIAEEYFIKTVSNKEIPDDIPTVRYPAESNSKISILNLLSHQYETVGKFVDSKSEAKRLIIGGGVKVDGEKIEDINAMISLEKERTIQAGKRKFIRVIRD